MGVHYIQQNRANVGQGHDACRVTSVEQEATRKRPAVLLQCGVLCPGREGRRKGLRWAGLWDSPDVRREGGEPCSRKNRTL